MTKNGFGGVERGVVAKMDSRMSNDRRRRHGECCSEGEKKSALAAKYVASRGSVHEVDLVQALQGRKRKNKLKTFYVLNDLRGIERSCDIFHMVYTFVGVW